MSGQNTLGLLDGLNDHIAISLHLRHKECEVRTGWRIEGPDSRGTAPLDGGLEAGAVQITSFRSGRPAAFSRFSPQASVHFYRRCNDGRSNRLGAHPNTSMCASSVFTSLEQV